MFIVIQILALWKLIYLKDQKQEQMSINGS